jgi:hypothetical protein
VIDSRFPDMTSDHVDEFELRADCDRCVGLCCVAPAFAASADFALDKAAGVPCPHLTDRCRCSIHDDLRPRGFPGCATYDCYGAGQKVAQVTFAGRSWRRDPGVAKPMFAVFATMRQLHELLWLLAEAVRLHPGDSLERRLQAAYAEIDGVTRADSDAVLGCDVAPIRRSVHGLLSETSATVRAGAPGARVDHRGADLMGADLRGADLGASDLAGAYLIGADLRRANLRAADVRGADFRAADLSGADLRDALFLTQSQLDAANGDADTRLPAPRSRPRHW